jgi:hypothetical protein
VDIKWTTATGEELDRLGELVGVKRRNTVADGLECDNSYRRLIALELIKTEFKREYTGDFDIVLDPNGDVVPLPILDRHIGHEIIDNWAGGKSFRYCRNCKVEVA